MIKRDAEAKLLNQAGKFPAVSVTGPRQSGKTTLVRQAFPDHEYVTFENPDNRSFFESDPRSFLSLHKSNVIFDEAQRVPDLFSYLQEIIDDSNEPGRFVLTGSQNFLLLKAVSQSLAGRVALFTLLPLSYHELASAGLEPKRAADWVFNGGYPRVFSSGIDPQSFFPSYIDTYLQRDVREELGVRSLSAFGKFLQLCALSCGNLLNVTGLARGCGVDTKTARDWLSILEASHIVYLLEPYFSNARKRLIKTPKLYFLDTGLACNLIGIDSPEELMTSPQYGALFEAAIIDEALKTFYAEGRPPQLSFWRDGNKNEIDLLVQRGLRAVKSVEVKSSATYKPKYFDALTGISERDLGLGPSARAVVYGGNENAETKRGGLVSFRKAWRLFSSGALEHC